MNGAASLIRLTALHRVFRRPEHRSRPVVLHSPAGSAKTIRRKFMKRSVVVFSTAVALCCLAPAVRAADQKAKAAADDVTITLDAAMDASSARAGRQDW